MDTESYEPDSPAKEWDAESTKHALDELFNATYLYRASEEYYKLIQFVRRFRFYSPYNGLLIHIQRPGATFVAPSYRWKREYGRRVKPDATPIIILQPMGPVMFVFDVSDTEETPEVVSLPSEVVNPFHVRKGYIGAQLKYTIDNAVRDGIRILEKKMGSQSAGFICCLLKKDVSTLTYQYGKDRDGNPRY